jgi:hypothetical protein
VCHKKFITFFGCYHINKLAAVDNLKKKGLTKPVHFVYSVVRMRVLIICSLVVWWLGVSRSVLASSLGLR